MTPEGELDAARRARAGDGRKAATIQREQEAERQVTAPERRSLGKLARDVTAWIAEHWPW